MNTKSKPTLSELCHKVLSERKLPNLIQRNETVVLEASYRDNDQVKPQIEIFNPDGNVIVESTEMEIIAEGSGECGNTTFARYYFTIPSDAKKGLYRYMVNIFDGEYGGKFEVIE